MKTVSWGIAALLMAALGGTAPAAANDSEAELGAGGLILVESADIVMAEEDLFIGPDEVRIHYVFENRGTAPVERLIAFPLPELDLARLSEIPVNYPAPDSANFVGFTVMVAGQAVPTTLEARAYLDGREVSDMLRPLGLLERGIDIDREGGLLTRLPEAELERLAQAGLIVREPVEQLDGVMIYNRPLWTLKPAFYWRQRFPVGRLEVEHRYRPVAGAFFVYDGLVEEDAMIERYCLDEGARKAIAKRFDPGETETLARTVDYVLSSGANWAGPIGRFRLTVDKRRPEALVSFCGDGVKKIGPTRFSLEYRDFEPKGDLSILFLASDPP